MSGRAASGVLLAETSYARIYDYLLGGCAHTGPDRAVGGRLRELAGWLPEHAGLGRAFTRHAVRAMTEAGIGQFLDLGSGLPTAGNTPEILAAIAPGARVVCVESCPIAVETGRILLRDVPHAAMLRADLREADYVLRKAAAGLLDLSRPVGLLLVEAAHHLPDPLGDLLGGYRARLAAGSGLALTHRLPLQDDRDPVATGLLRALGGLANIGRTREEINALMKGFTLRPPGLAAVADHLPGRAPAPGASSAPVRALLGAVGFLRPGDEHGPSPPPRP